MAAARSEQGRLCSWVGGMEGGSAALTRAAARGGRGAASAHTPRARTVVGGAAGGETQPTPVAAATEQGEEAGMQGGGQGARDILQPTRCAQRFSRWSFSDTPPTSPQGPHSPQNPLASRSGPAPAPSPHTPSSCAQQVPLFSSYPSSPLSQQPCSPRILPAGSSVLALTLPTAL